jgi:hypothetical protein
MPLFETGLIIACAVALAPWAVMACPGSRRAAGAAAEPRAEIRIL